MLPTQSMNLKKVLKKVMYACMSAAMIAVPTVPAYAAQNDVIDTTRTASLTIHKYDMTAAKKGGVNLDQFTSTIKDKTAAADEVLRIYEILTVHQKRLVLQKILKKEDND